ncbi:MAG: family 10 glycosylhydrolase [Haliscomenobacter sp.]|nr:family 10 glycosylhydrolase [Haliscomenobacter sp.]MBK9490698.1 family 10 glycosylhydrolase [Haliscomenobacter sp.]
MIRCFLPLCLCCLAIFGFAQPIAAPKQEFRGAWISTVINLDWPIRGASPSQQQAELLRIFEDLKKAGINAIFFQLRSESDAFYQSSLEPWSYYLTGKQGQSPSPFWDPLEFAIRGSPQARYGIARLVQPF